VAYSDHLLSGALIELRLTRKRRRVIMSRQGTALGPVLAVLIALIAASLACGGGATDTPTPRPAPTDTPTTEPEVVEGLKEEIFFEPGGGGGQAGCLGCPGEGSSPEISWGDLDCICLRGFPLDEEITVELHSPNGQLFSGTFQVEEGKGEAALLRLQPPLVNPSVEAGFVGKEYDGVPAIWIKLWGSASLPTGRWSAVARSKNAVAKAALDLDELGWEQISVVPLEGANPFEGERGLAHRSFCCSADYYNVYSPGERIGIVGVDLPPGQDLPLGIYHSQPDSADQAALVHSQMVRTDNRGTARTFLDVDRSYAPGCYTVMVETDPELDYGESPYHGGLQFTGPAGCFRVP
jgi:hypothetical protein